MSEITIKTTKVFSNIIAAAKGKRYIVLFGGSSSGKTIAALQYLYLYGIKYPNKRLRVISETLPLAKKGVLRDFKEIVVQDNWDDNDFNKSDLIYRFKNGSILEFLSGDEPSKFKAARADISLLDEVNHIPEEVFKQVDIRTRERLIVTFNPSSTFWIQQYWDGDAWAVFHSTYKDNPYVEQSVIDALESKIDTDPNFFRVYVEGKFGVLKGLIFEEGTNWDLVDDMPADYSDRRLGLDFGFSSDPAAVVDIKYHNGELYLDEVLYETHLLNSMIYAELSDFHNLKVIADSAEPKSIADLKSLGLNIHPSVKGNDSINNGISLLKEFKLNVTKRSVNLIKELRAYRWATDKEGNSTNKPVDAYNHLLDALRYATKDMLSGKKIVFI